eukprot:scaffold45806_cov237-Amphora_coffeaeformis.AAC.10
MASLPRTLTNTALIQSTKFPLRRRGEVIAMNNKNICTMTTVVVLIYRSTIMWWYQYDSEDGLA